MAGVATFGYLIFGSPRSLSLVKSFYKRKSLTVYDTEFNRWILVLTDPKEVLPNEVLSRVSVKSVPLEESWRYLKSPAAEVFKVDRIKVGDFVEITDGSFRGMRGKVKSLRSEQAEVVILVFGKPTVVDVPLSNLKRAF